MCLSAAAVSQKQWFCMGINVICCFRQSVYCPYSQDDNLEFRIVTRICSKYKPTHIMRRHIWVWNIYSRIFVGDKQQQVYQNLCNTLTNGDINIQRRIVSNESCGHTDNNYISQKKSRIYEPHLRRLYQNVHRLLHNKSLFMHYDRSCVHIVQFSWMFRTWIV